MCQLYNGKVPCNERENNNIMLTELQLSLGTIYRVLNGEGGGGEGNPSVPVPILPPSRPYHT